MSTKIATVKSTNNSGKECRIVFNGDYDEYEVRLFEGLKYHKAATYFTDDYKDAMSTAQVMANI